MPDGTNYVWQAQPGPQLALIECEIFEVFYGGARGGGKTDGALGEFVYHADLYGQHAIGLMVRRTLKQLRETIQRSKHIYRGLASYNDTDKEWTFQNGARLVFAYLERDDDADNYQGHSYTRVYVEEIGNFPNAAPIFKLMATLRSGAGVPCGFRATGNPGGAGHQWVKARYIDPAPGGWRIIRSEFVNPFDGSTITKERIFIPSRLSDNRYLGSDYVANLHMSGSPELVRAWLEGDWNVVAGAFFPEFGAGHIIGACSLPDTWPRFRSADWGSARPFSVGWWTISDGSLPDLPRGSLVRYREWYGWNGNPNEGCRLTAEEVGAGIVQRDGDEKISNGGSVLDPSAFAEDGGPSIAERISNGSRDAKGLPRVLFRRADNKRVTQKGAMGGWDQVRARLKGIDGKPMIYFMDNCIHAIRTLPALQHDELRPEDVDTEGEDHACFAKGTIIDGLGHVECIGILTRCATDVVRVSFEDGGSVVCTPDHLFMGDDGSWIRADGLINHRLCSATQLKNSWGRDITAVVSISSARAVDCIARFGCTIEDRYQKVSMFIIETMTGLTTSKRTLSYCLRRSTSPIMATGMLSLETPRVQRPLPGMAVQKAENGIQGTIKRASPPRWPKLLTRLARCVGSLLRRSASLSVKANSATPIARPKLCVAVERLSEKQDVYCLPSKDGWLSVSGLVASNCDEIRYACMSRPFLRRDVPKPEPTFPGLPIGGPGVRSPNTRSPTIDELWRDHERRREEAW